MIYNDTPNRYDILGLEEDEVWTDVFLIGRPMAGDIIQIDDYYYEVIRLQWHTITKAKRLLKQPCIFVKRRGS